MSHHQDFFGRVRVLGGAIAASSGITVAACLSCAAPAFALLPVTADCRPDAGGANDQPGESDVTRACAVVGNGAPFDLVTTASLDLARIEGAATIRACTLLNTDGDAFANLAVCTAVKGATGNNGNHLLLKDFQLYTCTDASADRCSDAALVAGPYSTTCEAAQEKADPFPGPGPGPGTHYPEDTLVRCQIDTADFSGAAITAKPLDTCSYSSDPGSAPSDCLAFRACDSHDDCEDESPCTTDTCHVSGVCRYVPKVGASCSNSTYCDGDERCTSLGLCGSADDKRDCDDGVACTLDNCDEISDSCLHQPRNSVCSDDLYCSGVESCDVVLGCQPGTPPDCTDGVGCTADTCNEETDGCDHVSQGEACGAVLAELAGQSR